MPRVVDVHTLEDGAQPPEAIAERLVDWLGAASRSLDLALYDVRLPGPVGDGVAEALRAAMRRGVRVRLAFNDDTPGPDPRPFEPPPPSTERHVLEELGAELKGIPGWRDLMHHKYVVRDGAAVWTGSMNWTLDSWTRQENVIATVEDAAVAAAYARDFGQLWESGTIGSSGKFDTPAAGRRAAVVHARAADGRSRTGSPSGSRPRAGACGSRRRWSPQARSWRRSTRSSPSSRSTSRASATPRRRARSSASGRRTRARSGRGRCWSARWRRSRGKRSTPYESGSVHDFMHAKVTVADDVVFLGSFNLSRSGEMNAENVLEIADPALAERLAAWIDGLRARYPDGI